MLHRLKYVMDVLVHSMSGDAAQHGFESCSLLFTEYQRQVHVERVPRQIELIGLDQLKKLNDQKTVDLEEDEDDESKVRKWPICNGILKRCYPLRSKKKQSAVEDQHDRYCIDSMCISVKFTVRFSRTVPDSTTLHILYACRA